MRRVFNWLVAAVLAACVAAGASAATAGTTAAVTGPGAVDTAAGLAGDVGSRLVCQGPTIACPGRFLVGLSVPRVLDRGPNLTSLEAALAHRADLIGSYQDFTEPMYTDKLKAAIRSGRAPVVTWEPFDAGRTSRNSYPLRRIAAGAYDGYLREAADQAKAVGAPFLIRFGHEMNGFWYPWGQPRPLHPQNVADPGNTPADYVAAYRHVVDVFRARGAANVAWMWSPNVTDANPNVTLRSLYPGDAYVDVIGLSGYEFRATDTFESRYRPTLTELRSIGTGKPVFIAETGVFVSDDRAAQLTEMLEGMAAEPRVAAVMYFNQPDKAIDYRIDSDTAAQTAFRRVLAEPRFALGADDLAAFATTPLIDGVPRVGGTLHAGYTWRGPATRTSTAWLSCPAATTPSAQCTRVGWGAYLTLDPEQRGRYVRATLGVVSPTATDFAERTVGPVLNVPPKVTPAGIDLLASSVRVRFPAAPPQSTHWIVGLDDGSRTYLPIGTTEYYVNGLPTGSSHTLTLAACDCPSTGQDSTSVFTVVPRPATPAYTTSAGSYTVTLPDPAPGQTGWVALSDGVEDQIPVATTTVTKTGLTPGGHSFGLRAVGGDARTNPTFVYPQVP
jgi:hypothetical protein